MAHPAISRHGFVLKSRDCDEAASLLRTTAVPYSSELLKGSPPFATEIFVVQSPRISVSRVRTSGAMRVHSMLPSDSFALLIDQGNGVGTHSVRGEVFELDSGTGFLQSPLDDVRVLTTSHFEISFLRFPRDWVERELQNLILEKPQTSLLFACQVRMQSSAGKKLLLLVDQLRRMLYRTDAHALQTSVPVRDLENQIVALLLQAQPHNYSKLLHHRSAAGPWHVRAAQEYIADNADMPLSLGDICLAAGTNARTLQHWFRIKIGCSPIQFLHRIRMERVHLELSNPQAHTTVTDEALRFGFLHLGRFAQGYFSKFGEQPSQTLRRARRRIK